WWKGGGPAGRAGASGGGEVGPFDRADGRDARANRTPAGDHRARAALSQAAAELGAAQREVVAEDVEQRCLGVDVDGVSLAVDREGDSAHGRIIAAHGPPRSSDPVPA